MARPSKATVDYFPLVCKFSDSIDAVENIYGNDGFVVWVKLLQKLGRTENHFIDLRTNTAWKLFYSIFKIEESQVYNILDTLAELECIDKILWEHKIIYSQNFIKGISEAYRKRSIVLLDYEEILALVGVSPGRNPHGNGVSSGRNPVSGAGNPQSKLKETKEKESKKEVVVDSNQTIEIVSSNDSGAERIERVSNNQTTTTTTNLKIPTLEEVRLYAKERGNKANPDKFHAHYEGKNWSIKNKPMTDWRAAFRYWEQNEKHKIENKTQGELASRRPELVPYKAEKILGDPPGEAFKRFGEKVRHRI